MQFYFFLKFILTHILSTLSNYPQQNLQNLTTIIELAKVLYTD
jgi:hypothetical protein